MSAVLRDYQTQAMDGIRALYAAGRTRVLLVSPTGSGKTVTMASIISAAIKKGSSVLFLAHRRELIQQCSEKLADADVEHGIVMAGVPPLPWLHVQVASIPTLNARIKAGGALPHANLVVIDEAHHARAGTYNQLLAAYPRASVLGATATPWRTDGRGLGELFEDIVVAAKPHDLIGRGFLVPYTGLAYDTPDTQKLQRKGSDYEQHGLEVVMSQKTIVGNVVEQYREHAAGQRGVVFAVTVKHSLDLVERFKLAGVPAEHLDGTTPTAERDAILRRLKSGTTKIVCNVGVLTEGFDAPMLEVVILARPTLSTGLYLQMVGRGMRPACLSCGAYAHPQADSCGKCGSSSIKRVCRIHDHAGCILEHGMPDADREYALDSDERPTGNGEKLAPLRTCKVCFAIFDAAETCCPSCGHVNPPVARVIKEIDNASVRATPLSELPQFKAASEDTKRAHYERLVAAANEKGHRKGAAAMKFKAIYGCWPTAAWRYDVEGARRSA